MRIAVVGAGGQLGAAIVHEFTTAPSPYDVVPFTRADLDAADDGAVARTIGGINPDAIINCAAYNQVDAAEDHPVDALEVNAFAVRALARAADRAGAVLFHYGSDFVFDGTAAEPYAEDAKPNPLSAYGASKMLGEWFALDAGRAYVLRVESLFGRAPGGPPAKGSAAAIMNALAAGSRPRVFRDRVVSPTYIADAARATRVLLETSAPWGLYHCVNSGRCTWLEFATELARLLGVAPNLEAVGVADVSMRAQRPRYCALSNEKLRQAGVDMPSWQAALAHWVEHAATETRSERSLG